MNFFEHQDKARKKTFWLVLYFILAIALIILAIDVVVVGAVAYGNPETYFPHTAIGYNINQNALINLALTVTLAVSPIIIAIIVIGTIIKTIALRNGGIAVAEMVGATPISPETVDFLEKRFVNIVEEMSIASGVSIPRLYVMENEKAINAFVSGIRPEDTVMVVTRGALEQLSRDELQGVVGHEFSHIFNSDMQISIRLMGILGGLLVIGQLGYFLLRYLSMNNRRSDDRSDGRIGLMIIIIGVGLFVIGYIGLFFGRLIKAAVSRQRELLADASSVQYTRNPQGILFALKRIQQSEKGTGLNTKNVEDISHICFGPPRWVLFSNLLATHPPIENRIRLLDPQGQFDNAPLEDLSQKNQAASSKEKKKIPDMVPVMVGAAVLAGSVTKTNLSQVKQSIGNPTDEHIALAKALLATIPDDIKKMAHNPQQVEFIFYALMLISQPEKSNFMEKALAESVNAEGIQETHNILNKIVSLPKTTLLPLIDISLPAFKANSLEKRRSILTNMSKLVPDQTGTLSQFLLLTLVNKALEDKPGVAKTKFQGFQPVMGEIGILMALLIKSAKDNQEQQTVLYNKIMKHFGEKIPSFEESSQNKSFKLQQILTKLNLLSPLCKEKLINACLECVQDDQIINVNEAQLVRAVAVSIGCPIPPILGVA